VQKYVVQPDENGAFMRRPKIILTSILGTVLEFYDFTLYGVFAAILAKVYFPTHSETASLLAAYGAFLAGFIMRPFGALMFGYFGDKFGRKKALSFSILFMGLPTLVIGITPSFEMIGLLAPLIIVGCRLLQGASAGGEYNGASIFALEHMGNKYPGFVSALIGCSGGIGGLLAMAMGFMVTSINGPSWIWRIPFILGAFISLLGFYLRRRIDETPVFEAMKKNNKISKTPLKEMIRNYFSSMAITFSIGALDGAVAYSLIGFMNGYLTSSLGIPLSDAMFLNMVGLAVYLLSTPLMGLWFDFSKPTLFIRMMCLSIVLLMPLVFWMMQMGTWHYLLGGEFIFALLFGALSGAQGSYMQQLFPSQGRYTGISFSYSLGSTIFGGTAPILLTYLISESSNLLVPGYFLSALGALCFIITFLKLPKAL